MTKAINPEKQTVHPRQGNTKAISLLKKCACVAILLAFMCALLTLPSVHFQQAYAEPFWNVTISVEGFGELNPIQVEDGDTIAMEQLEETEGFSAFEVQHEGEVFILTSEDGTQYYRTGADSLPVGSDLQLTGRFEAPAEHTVTVNFANGQESLEVSVPAGQSWVEAGNAIPNDPTKAGHSFAGWTNLDTDDAFNWNAAITKDTLVMAEWQADSAPSDNWENIVPPESVTGNALSVKSWKGSETDWGSERRFQMKFLSATDDWFKQNVASTLTAYCADPGAWSAHTGEFSYAATRTSWNPDTGEATYDIVFSPTDATASKAYKGTHSLTGPLFKEHSGKADGLQRGVVLNYKVKVQVKVPLKVTKTSANTQLSEGNGSYSLAGATYGIFANESDAKAGSGAIQTLVTNQQGTTPNSKMLAPGTYYIKELSPAQGYALDNAIHKVDVQPNKAQEGVVPVKVSDMPQNAPLDLVLGKLDKETKEHAPIEAASLAGAEFTIAYFDNTAGNTDAAAKRTWVFKTDEKGEVHLSKDYLVDGTFYTNSEGTPTMPLGTYAIRETKAPEGYLINGETITRTITASGTNEAVHTWNTPDGENGFNEQVKRGDIEFIKVNGQSMESMAGVVFLLTANKSGESHVLVTDENGMASTANSWNAHSTNTNASDAALTKNDAGNYSVDSSKLDAEAGIWFGTNSNGSVSAPDDGLGALPYGTYTLTEIPSDANANMAMITRTFTVSRNNVKLNLGTIDNSPLHIGTSAQAGEGDDAKAYPSAETTIVDTISYDGLVPGREYRAEGTLMDKATGEPLLVNGESVNANATFTPSTSHGTTQVKFTFDGSSLLGTSVVVFERLFEASTQVASHENLEDEGQTLTFSCQIGTTATNAEDGSHVASPAEKVTIADEVSYKGLVPGMKYTCEGTLMDKATGEAVLVDGEPLVASTTFTPEDSDGSVVVEFIFNATTLAGKEVVAFETLKRDEVEVATHANLEDEGQTVRFTYVITTTASDVADGDHQVEAGADVEVVDVVHFQGLSVGQSYTVKGKLMNKETGEPLLAGGKEVTAETEFVANESEGDVSLKFAFNTTNLDNASTVVFEELYDTKAKLVAEHKDVNSAEQSIWVGNTPEDEPEKPDTPITSLAKTFDTPGKQFAIVAALALAAAAVGYNAYRFNRLRRLGLWDTYRRR